MIGHKACDLRFRQIARPAARADAGAEQHFADVDVAKTRHDVLIQQRRLDRRAAALQPGGEVGFVEVVAQGFGAKVGQQRMLLGRGRSASGPSRQSGGRR